MPSPFVFSFDAPPSPTVTTPTAVFDLMRQVEVEIAGLDQDIGFAALQGLVFPAGWREQRSSFVDEWRNFVSAYVGIGWTVTLPGTAWDQTAQYEAKNEAWRDKFKALGGNSVGPGPQDRPQGADVTGAVKWCAAAVIAAVVAYGVYEFVPKRRSN